MSTLAASFAYRSFDADESQRFSEASQEIQDTLQARLDYFSSSVRQLAGIYAANPDMNQQEFSDLTRSTGINVNDAGIYSIGIFRRLSGPDGVRYLVWMRQLAPHAPSTLAPLKMDITGDTVRVKIFAESIDSAQTLLTMRVPGIVSGQKAGALMTAAAYEGIRVPSTLEERRRLAIGISYARFSETGLFDQPLQNSTAFKNRLRLRIFELSGKSKQPIYLREPQDQRVDETLARFANFELKSGGRVFRVEVTSPLSILRSTASLIAILILAIGVGASLVIFRVLSERERLSQRLHFLEDVSSLLGNSLNPSVVAEHLTKKLLTLGDWCVIELLNEQGETIEHLYSATSTEKHKKLSDFYRDFPPNSSDARVTLKARQTKQIQLVHRVSTDALQEAVPGEARRQRLIALGFESMIVAPLLAGDRVVGTLAVYSGDKRNLYTEADVDLIETIAARAAIAFENSYLYMASQKLHRAKDDFLAMLSHELRTPMNVILGWIEILKTEEVDKETYTQALETLDRNSKVQIQLISDLLDVSRIINGKLSLHASLTDLAEVVRGSLDSVQPAARAKQIQCSVEIAGNLKCTVDSERIQQVLWNLLSNAAKFTPAGGRIGVRAEGRSNEVEIAVTDSGIGIETEFLPYVFDRFRQEEVGFARTQGGLGLGLSIVRYLVEGHGGTIRVDSAGRGLGSTFTVTLPRVAIINTEPQLTS